MAENIIILGAGASAEAGAPLMSNFLDTAEDLLREGAFGSDSDMIRHVFRTISYLQGIYAKSFLDLNNIEALFGAIEMAIIINKLGDYSKEDILMQRDALITLIVKTLEKKTHFPVSNKSLLADKSYQKLVDILKEKGIGQTTIITFNYDIALDYALSRNNVEFDYCLSQETRPYHVKLLKLHGSLNWGKCSYCGHIEPFYLREFFRNTHLFLDEESTGVRLAISEHLNELKMKHSHEKGEVFNPVIVPPTWNKTDYHGSLTNVWNIAANELNEARNIYVFGYSLPETDSFFRYLFALGTVGDSRIRRFWVFDPDQSGELENRYKQMIGQGIINRFEFINKKFGEGLIELRKRIL